MQCVRVFVMCKMCVCHSNAERRSRCGWWMQARGHTVHQHLCDSVYENTQSLAFDGPIEMARIYGHFLHQTLSKLYGVNMQFYSFVSEYLRVINKTELLLLLLGGCSSSSVVYILHANGLTLIVVREHIHTHRLRGK